MGTGRSRGGERPRPGEGSTPPPAAPSFGRVSVHAEVVGSPRDGGAIRGDRLHPWPGSAGVDPTRGAATRGGPHVGRRRAGAVARRVST